MTHCQESTTGDPVGSARGKTRRTPELMAEVRTLREGGLKLKEISKATGIPLSTVGEWLLDPDLVKHRERRMRYGGTCIDCGADTDGSRGAARRCRPCQIEYQRGARYWTQERIVEAMQQWAERHGKTPSARDWRTAGEDGTHPPTSTVQNRFGSWAAGLRAAGLTPCKVGRPRKVAA